MTKVYLGVGSNLGSREAMISAAREAFEKNPLIYQFRSSTFIETKPVGGPPQNNFLNGVWEFETNLTPEELLNIITRIETELGRKRVALNGPRTIDLDILFYGTSILKTSKLTIPHPRLHDRSFVLEPFAELNADWKHPVLKRSIQELLDEKYENIS